MSWSSPGGRHHEGYGLLGHCGAGAGPSRPVLYRRWPRRDDLLLATMARFWKSQPPDLLRHDTLMTMRALPDESIIEIVDEVWLPLLGLRPLADLGGAAGPEGRPELALEDLA